MNVDIKKWVPKSIKQRVKNMLLRRQLRDAVRAISKLPAGQIPDRQQLSELIAGWSNEGYVANLEYLEAVAKSSINTRGPVLECGSGATTILLGILCGRRNVEVWSLENSPEWQNRVTDALNTNGIFGVHVCTSPLIEYGDYVWYDPPLAQMPKEFSLVICDGPPGDTKGGRYGLLPVMGDTLPPGSTILLDDAGRPGELELIRKWEAEATFQTELIKTQGSQYAVMRRG
jgi:hypothetical protein